MGDGVQDANERFVHANFVENVIDGEVVELEKLLREEFKPPVYTSLYLTVIFWIAVSHPDILPLPLFLAVLTIILWHQTINKKIKFTSIYFRSLDVRLIQLLLMYTNLLLVDIFGYIFLNLNSTRKILAAGSFEELHEHFQSISSAANPFGTFLQITGQVFWLTIMITLLMRTSMSLVFMCKTVEFRKILRFEVRHFISVSGAIILGSRVFNYMGKYHGHTLMSAWFYIITLALWIIFCLAKSNFYSDDILVTRTNNANGLLQMVTVTAIQGLLCGVILNFVDVFSSAIEYFQNGSDNVGEIAGQFPTPSVQKYYTDIKNGKLDSKHPKDILFIDMEFLTDLASIALVTRMIKHTRYFTELDRSLIALNE